jgi:hypothetical protein
MKAINVTNQLDSNNVEITFETEKKEKHILIMPHKKADKYIKNQISINQLLCLKNKYK